MKKHTPTSEAQEKGLNWALRKWLAAASISFCFGALVIDATLRQEIEQEQQRQALAEAELEQLVAGFESYIYGDKSPATLASFASAKPADDLTSFDFNQIEMAKIRADEKRCLSEAIYFEARAEPLIGQMAVADVIINRVKSPLYPDSICGVVYQGSTRSTGCQFSFTCDGSMKRKREPKSWEASVDLAGAILAGVHIPVSRNATNYHADYVLPKWAPNLTPTATIGAHKFYRSPDRTFTAAAQ